jgi:Flp pilus assembly protein protease CpaA
MALAPTLSHVVLVITAGVLFYVALTDLKYFKIRNELILVLAGLYILHALLSGRWVSAHWNLGFAALMFSIMLYFYTQNAMGGGDVKILTIAFLWLGVGCAFPLQCCLRSARRCMSRQPGSVGPMSKKSAVASAFRWHLRSRRQ